MSKNYPYISKDDVVLPAHVFDRRIKIEYLLRTDDGAGGYTHSWATLVKTWAHVQPWKGFESWAQSQTSATLWLQIFLRYRPSLNIDASMRVVYLDHIYNIRYIKVPAEAQHIIELLAQELQAKGSL